MLIDGCSRVPNNVPEQTKALYKRLGFNDKDNDGVIEKRSILKLQFKEEGYAPGADVNEDGRIVEAEAKYYLRTLENISSKDKQAFELTKKDLITLKSLFQDKFKEIRNMWGLNLIDNVRMGLQFDAYINTAKQMRSIGLLDLSIVQEVKALEKKGFYSFNTDKLLGHMIDEMIQDRRFYCALATSKAIICQDWRTRSVEHILTEMPKAGFGGKELMLFCEKAKSMFNPDKEDHYFFSGTIYSDTFVDALINNYTYQDIKNTILSIKDDKYREEILIKMANKFIRALRPSDNDIERSVDIVKLINNPNKRDEQYSKIVDKKLTNWPVIEANDYKKALEIADLIVNSENKAGVLSQISLDLASFGLFKNAIDVAKRIKDPNNKVKIVQNISDRIKSEGSKLNKLESNRIFGEALANARASNEPIRKALDLADIAFEMSKKNVAENEIIRIFNESLDNAFMVTGRYRYSDNKADAVGSISVLMGGSNLRGNKISAIFMKAISVVETIGVDRVNKAADDKMYALIRIAEDITNLRSSKKTLKPFFIKALRMANDLRGYMHWSQVHIDSGYDIDIYTDCFKIAFERIRDQVYKSGFTVEEFKQILLESGVNKPQEE